MDIQFDKMARAFRSTMESVTPINMDN